MGQGKYRRVLKAFDRLINNLVPECIMPIEKEVITEIPFVFPQLPQSPRALGPTMSLSLENELKASEKSNEVSERT